SCRELILVKPLATIGRGAQCDIRIPVDAVSSHHAKLRIYSTHAVVQDEGSLNGVLVNGVRISGPVEIGQGSVIQLGPGGPTIRILDGVPPVATAGPVASPSGEQAAYAGPLSKARGPRALYGIAAVLAGMFLFVSC